MAFCGTPVQAKNFGSQIYQITLTHNNTVVAKAAISVDDTTGSSTPFSITHQQAYIKAISCPMSDAKSKCVLTPGMVQSGINISLTRISLNKIKVGFRFRNLTKIDTDKNGLQRPNLNVMSADEVVDFANSSKVSLPMFMKTKKSTKHYTLTIQRI